MKKPSPYGNQAYDPTLRKTFRNALCHLLQTEFPGVFGPMITRLLAERIDALYDQFHPPGSRFKVGQVLWTGVAIGDRPTQKKRIEDTKLVPVILDLVTAEDITQARSGGHMRLRRARLVRLFRQAYEQGAVLSQADVSLLTHIRCGAVSAHVRRYEQETGETVPRRGTIHDLGRTVTHKGVICYRVLVERKSTSQVAEETFHSAEAVERYVQCFRRIQLCRDNGMSIDDIANATGHSLSLVREYLNLMKQFQIPPLPHPAAESGDSSNHSEAQKTKTT